ncbi:MAG: hypothetical protein WCT04_11515 [Planctomycetota bacterium]
MTKHEMVTSAKALVGTKSRAEISKALDEQKEIVAKETEARDALTDNAARITATGEVKKATEEAVVLHMALDILDKQDATEDALFKSAVTTLSRVGIKVKEPVSDRTLSEVRNANKSFFSRLF